MIAAESIEFLRRLLDAPGPSGFELRAARAWRAEAERVAHQVSADVNGNSIATVNPGGSPRVMLAGHIDEIRLIVTYIDDDGFLFVDGIGGWDPQVLVGQRMRILARDEDVIGVIGKKPVHLMKNEEKEKATKLPDLWIDVGVGNREEALGRGIRVGDAAVIDTHLVQLGDGLIASRSVDDRIGAFLVLETLRLLRARAGGLAAEVHAVATVQEEIAYQGGGARTSAYHLDPQVALVVDVTFATDYPQSDKKSVGEHKLGSGPVLARGSAAHPLVFDRLVEAAEAEGIPFTIQASPRSTSTDADAIYLSRTGVPTGVVSVPNRYMHSPNEVVSLADLEATARLLAAFITGLDASTSFVPR